jgi:PII-like signaling protein
MQPQGERVLMRIIREQDKFEGKPQRRSSISAKRNTRHGVPGHHVVRNSKIHSDRFLELSLDLPIVIECVETEERIKAILPELDNMIGGGLITLERAKVIMYRPHELADEEADDWSVDVTGSQLAVRPSDHAS